MKSTSQCRCKRKIARLEAQIQALQKQTKRLLKLTEFMDETNLQGSDLDCQDNIADDTSPKK